MAVNNISDSYTDANGTNLTAHTGELNAGYTKHTLFTDNITIENNRAAKDSGTGTAVYYTNAQPSQLKYRVKIVMTDIGNVNRACGMAAWIDTATDSMIVFRRQTATVFQLLKIISGTPSSTLLSAATSFSANAQHTIELIRHDSDMFEAKLDDVSIGTIQISDSVFQSPGRVGIRASNNHSGTGYHVDSLAVDAQRIDLSVGSFSVTGSAVTLTHGYVLAAGGGSFSLTGNAQTLQATRKLSAGVAGFSESGQAVGLRAGKTMALTQGSFVETGNPTTLLIGRKLSAVAGVFTETGGNVSLLFSRRDSASFGSFALDGIEVSLRSDRKLDASAGLFTETVFDVGLVYQPIGNFVLSIGSGAFVLTGNEANLLRSRIINASAGVFAEISQGVSLLWGRRLEASAGIFLETGFAQLLLRGRVLQLGAFALYVLDGEDVELLHDETQRLIAIQSGSFALSGFPVVLHLRRFWTLPEDILKVHRTDNVLRVARSSATLRVAPD